MKDNGKDHLDPISPCANLPPDSLDTLVCAIRHLSAGDAVNTLFIHI